MNHEVLIRQETMDMLMDIIGDTGENESFDELVNRLARFYLEDKAGREK